MVFDTGGEPYPDGSLILAVTDAGGGPYPYGSPMLAVGYAGKPVTFNMIGMPVDSAVGGTDGKDGPLVGVIAVLAVVIEYVGSAPNSLSGIAVPTPLLVQGVGTGRSEVTGLACGTSE